MTSAIIILIGWRRYWWLASKWDAVANRVKLQWSAGRDARRAEELEHRLTGLIWRYTGKTDPDAPFEEIIDVIDCHIEQQRIDAVAAYIRDPYLCGDGVAGD